MWLTICICLSIFMFFATMASLDSADALMICLYIYLAIGVLGFGLICGGIASGETTTEIIIPEDIAKSDFKVFVNIDGKTFSNNDAKIVASLTENIRVKKTTKHNSYGHAMIREYEIVLAD